MLVIFYLTFELLGTPLQDIMDLAINSISSNLENFLNSQHVSTWIISLIIDGIFSGVGSVLSFLPIIILLFFFLSLLEDSGYMARVAFVMDKLLRKIGLSGKSFVPMLIGFGCSVPAIMSTRTLSSERDRKMTIILTPFMSCSAKLPIYSMITLAFFPKYSGLVMLSLYVLGMVVAIISGLLLKSTIFKGDPIPFVLELPAYRIPSSRSVFQHMLEKAKDFIRKAFTIIFFVSIIIWFLQHLSWSFVYVTNTSESILASLGSIVAPIFTPLGFSDYRLATALVTGITAKENVVGTLSVLTHATSDAQLSTILNSLLTPLSAYSFLAFTILYMPCVAAFAATKKELGSIRQAVYTALFQTGVAYLVAMFIYQFGSIIL